MGNPFTDRSTGLASPSGRIALITKNDSTDLPGGVCRAVLVGTAGTANLLDANGVTHTNVPLQQGYNPLGIMRLQTGGTCDNVWALY